MAGVMVPAVACFQVEQQRQQGGEPSLEFPLPHDVGHGLDVYRMHREKGRGQPCRPHRHEATGNQEQRYRGAEIEDEADNVEHAWCAATH